jgi:hypothetical protein
MIRRPFLPFDEDFLMTVALALGPQQAKPTPLWEEMISWDEERLARTDPAVLNLEVAKGIPDVADLEVEPYCRLLDQTVSGLFSGAPFYRVSWTATATWKTGQEVTKPTIEVTGGEANPTLRSGQHKAIDKRFPKQRIINTNLPVEPIKISP